MAELSEARKRANKKWDDAHKAERNYMKAKSGARSFVKNKATLADLRELRALITEREGALEEKKTHSFLDKK